MTEAATPQQQFLKHYQTQPLKAAALNAGISMFEAYTLAQEHGTIRYFDAVSGNSKNMRMGEMGEKAFKEALPEALPCNKTLCRHNPAYDFLIGDMRIDIKASSGATRGSYNFKCANSLECDLFVLFIKTDKRTEIDDITGYSHCAVIPSLFLLDNSTVQISRSALENKELAWAEFIIPREELTKTVRLLASSFRPLPEEIRQLAAASREVKGGTGKIRIRQ